MNKIILPELLSPAGSPEAFEAAIDGGADAIYVGGASFNARINAQNFSEQDLASAVKLAHLYGVKVYQTINVMVHGKETSELLRAAERSAAIGVDAFIVSDLGAASLIHTHLPEMPLHASTQMSVHNSSGARLLADYGFSRVVPARELSKENIRSLVENNPLEVEIFIHGAMCVSHSGQCLFSSLVGGRSGNRGLCAQPCRLPYACADQRVGDKYPLSLKDMSLAGHVREIIDSGVASLKIEGRMKSPEYVFGVTKAFRTLLDNGADASDREMSSLAKIFSRGGFTDGYYKHNINSSMLGIRSDSDKQNSKNIKITASKNITSLELAKTPVDIFAKIKEGEPCELTLSAEDSTVTVNGVIVQAAINAPLSFEDVKRSLIKLGNTPFCVKSFDAELSNGTIVPISALNALRRQAADQLEALLNAKKSGNDALFEKYIPESSKSERRLAKSARFTSPEQIPECAYEFFDIIYLPLDKFSGECNGIILPPVIFDSEREKIEKILRKARDIGAKHALVGNLGALELAKKYDFTIHGDFRLNAYNEETVQSLQALGVRDVMLSPELTLPQMRDIKGDVCSIVYGRLPLMLLEKCVIKEVASCDVCSQIKATITDRRGISFPVLREGEHRNIIYNSLPTYMADKEDELVRANVKSRHFIFSTESKDECERVIIAYKNHISPVANEKIRRI